MLKVSNADRIVFPALGRTKGDVVTYYERLGERALVHVRDRPLSIRRFPKGLAGPGFFQKNVPPHYPASIQRFAVARSHEASKKHRGAAGADQDVTLYPLLAAPEQLAYLANQGAIELHAPLWRAHAERRPDRLVIDLDPPPGSFAMVRRAAQHTRAALQAFGLASVPVATGSKGYHIVAPLEPAVDAEVLGQAMHKFSALLVQQHPDELTIAYRIALRGGRVFVDWLRNNPVSHVIAPYSLRASARATVAAPLSWDELEQVDPDRFSIDDSELLLARPDSLAQLAEAPGDTASFVARVEESFAASGLVLEPFDRFRS